MKFKKSVLICMILLVILSLGVVSADDNTTATDNGINEPIQDDGATASENHTIELVEDEDYGIYIPAEYSDPTYWGEEIVSVEGMPDDAKGNISISVDELERYNQKVISGPNAISLCNLNLGYGNHSILIKYSGDEKYSPFIKNSTSERVYLKVGCPGEFSADGGGFSLDVVLSKGVSGYVKILIDNKIVYNKKYDASNPPSISLNNYMGNHTYEVRYYKGNQKDLIKKGSFEGFLFYEPYFYVNYGEQIEYGDTVQFEIDMPYNSYGVAKLKDKEYPFDCDEDSWYAYIKISDFDVGENIVYFTVYSGDDSQTRDCSVFVSPKITVPTTLFVNESYELIFNASNDFNGNLILSGFINGTFKVSNGSVIVPFSGQNLGNYTLEARYENYTRNYNLSVLNESPEVFISFYYDDIIYPWDLDYYSDPDHGMFYHVNVNAGQYKLSGNTSIYVDDKLIDTLSGECEYQLWPSFDYYGVHTIKVVYWGDKTFKPITKTFNYTVSPYYCAVDEYGDVHVKLPIDAAGTLTVKCNGKTQTRKIKATEYGSYQGYDFLFDDFKKGENYTIDVSFKGKPAEYSFNQSLNYAMTCPINLEFDYYVYGQSNVFAFTMPNNIKNNAIVTIDGEKYNYYPLSKYDYENSPFFFYVDEESEIGYYVDIAGLKPGNHTVVISYPGDSKYPSASINGTIEIFIEFAVSEDDEVSLTLPADAEGNLTVEIMHKGESDYSVFKSVALKDGKAAIQLPIGSYDYKAYYTGDDYLVEERESGEIVYPDVSYKNSMNYGQNNKFKVNDDINGTLVFYLEGDIGSRLPVARFELNQTNEININKKFIDEILKQPMAKLIIQNNYVIYGYYSLDLCSAICSDVGTFDMNPICIDFKAKLTGAKAITMKYSEAKTFSLKVYDIYGKIVGKNQIVKIKIGKKTFSVKTDKNGVIKFKIPNTVTPGKYTITASYKGAKVSKKLTVKQILTLKTVKVKKSAKKLILTATLKKVNGKYLKGKKVTFKFNGKTYKAKTNKKGVAKVTIKKSALKKLKVGKKVKYQATYLKDTVKKTVKVKK